MSNSEIQVFNYQSNDIRTVMVDGQPWFVAKDVCDVLELQNPTMALSRLDDDEKALISIEGLSRGNDSGNIVNEPGLYSLVIGSRKPEAKAFKRWITHDVIPEIRKTGGYTAGTMSQLEIMRNMLDSQIQTEKRIERLEAKVKSVAETTEQADWCKWINGILAETAQKNGRMLNTYKGELYKELEQTEGCRISTRQTRLRSRMKKSGRKASEYQYVSRLMAIEADPKLKSAFSAIVRREASRVS